MINGSISCALTYRLIDVGYFFWLYFLNLGCLVAMDI